MSTTQKRINTVKSDYKKKKAKSYHCAKERTSHKGSLGIQVGMAGIMVTCARGREGKASKEIIDIFNEYADNLYPSEAGSKDNSNDTSDGTNDDDDDLETSIAKEVEAMKSHKTKRRFVSIPTNTDCILFIKTTSDVDPTAFVHHILTDMEANQVKRTRYVSRLLPIEKTCQANMSDIERLGAEITKPVFHTPGPDGTIAPLKFAVAARVRNCAKIDRSKVIDSLAAIVGPKHNVDLSNPDRSIIAEICQNICMMSVVRDFEKLKRYNIESLLGLNNPEQPKDGNSKHTIQKGEVE